MRMSSYSHAQVILQIIDRERKMSTHRYEQDRYGTPNPKYNHDMPRFQIIVRGYEPDDPDPDWQYKLTFIDHKYQDSDGLPIDAMAAGNCVGGCVLHRRRVDGPRPQY